MCNYVYIADYKNMPATMGKRCPYPDFYERVQAALMSTPAATPLPELLLDATGACLFHSRAFAWKRGNDLKGRFLQLVQLLKADKHVKWYDFAEFAFIGGEPATGEGLPQPLLHIADTTFEKQAYFTGAAFLDPISFESVDFKGGATFSQATFIEKLKVTNCRFNGLDFTKTKVGRDVNFITVSFKSFALFDNAQFDAIAHRTIVSFKDVQFECMATFNSTSFSLDDEGSVVFLGTKFEETADFTNAQFCCQAVFTDVSFAGATDFIDTLFGTAKSSARYRGSAVEFNRIDVQATASLTFRSSDPGNKMFCQDVQMSFKDDPAGTIAFENVNFINIVPVSRERLVQHQF